MDASHRKIAISGGGIAGLACALSLAHFGFHVDLYEKTKEFSELGAGLQLSPNATKILQKLGILDAVQNFGHCSNGLELRDGLSGKHLNTVPFGKVIKEQYKAPYLTIQRYELHQVLLDACKNQDKICLHLGAEIHSLQLLDDGVKFQVNNQEIDAKILIAADGIWSNLRQEIFSTNAHYMGEVAWRNQFPRQMVPKDLPMDGPSLWLGPKAHMVIYPILQGKAINVVATETTAEEALEPLQHYQAPHLVDKFKSWHAPIVEMLKQTANTSPWLAWPIYQIDPKRPWVKGNFCLIGDAAHAMPPFMAQGGCFAIEDGFVMAQTLKHSQGNFHSALKAYEAKRRPRVERLFKKVARNHAIYHMQKPLSFARNFVIKNMPAEKLLKQQDWIYGWEAE